MFEELENDKRKKSLIMENQNPDLENTQNSNRSQIGEECQYIPLPSKGYFYKNQFMGMDQLKVRQLDWTDEDILTTESFYQNGTVFNELLSRVIVDENGFTAKQLIPVDKDAILIWLRIAAFGPEYEIRRKCPKCKKIHKVSWDLSEIQSPDYHPDYLKEIQEHGEVEVILPDSKKKVKITIPSIGKEIEIQKQLEVKKEKTNSNQDYLITGKLLSSISAVYDEETKSWKRDKTSIAQFLSNGLKRISDSRHIIKVLKDITLKIDSKQDVKCPNANCNHFEEGVEMPMTIYFFWPEYEGIS